jgi:hypothetical protein
MKTAIFIRYPLPDKWKLGDSDWRYGGYSVLYVRCADEGELRRVQTILLMDHITDRELGGAGAHEFWYGGQFDLAAVIGGHPEIDRIASGDVRFGKIVDAQFILARVK